MKIEEHMAKEIIGINQLNGITQTDMIRQICSEVCGDMGEALRLMQIMENKLLKGLIWQKKYVQGRKERYEVFKADKLRTSGLLLDVCFLFDAGFHNTYWCTIILIINSRLNDYLHA